MAPIVPFIPLIAGAASIAGNAIASATQPDELDIINAQKQKTPEQKEAYSQYQRWKEENPLGSTKSPFSNAAENFALGSYAKQGTNFAPTVTNTGDLQNKLMLLRQKAAARQGGNPFVG